MGSAIEQTVKALVEFEAQLDSAKAGMLEAEKKAAKEAVDWAESAKAAAISKAQEMAAQTVARARENAGAEADRIRKKGEADLGAFEASISKSKKKASELVASRLLGEQK